jgi:hypothetical protein
MIDVTDNEKNLGTKHNLGQTTTKKNPNHPATSKLLWIVELGPNRD